MTEMTRGSGELHTYMVQRHRMRVGSPLTFSGGERIVAVVDASWVPAGRPVSTEIDVTMLVELPPADAG